MSRYSGDPYWLTARFNGKCHSCDQAIRKGDRAYYYPRERRLYGDPCGCGQEHAADFEAHAADEGDAYNPCGIC
ncbi:MAG: hypothetical protein P8J87_14380 [Verrucomicrobiales bacterium]|nr:hypothetical protein [Verrucomicrobiales bacterium]